MTSIQNTPGGGDWKEEGGTKATREKELRIAETWTRTINDIKKCSRYLMGWRGTVGERGLVKGGVNYAH